jgi:hypothetical protein
MEGIADVSEVRMSARRACKQIAKSYDAAMRMAQVAYNPRLYAPLSAPDDVG